MTFRIGFPVVRVFSEAKVTIIIIIITRDTLLHALRHYTQFSWLQR